MNRLASTRARISCSLQLQRLRGWQSNISTKTAIRKGLRSPSRERTNQSRTSDTRKWRVSPRRPLPTTQTRGSERKPYPAKSDFRDQYEKKDFPRSSPLRGEEKAAQWRRGKDSERKDFIPRRHSTRFATENEEREPPVSLPYTSSASEFLYGTNVVSTALKLNRRKFYKLFIYQGHQTEKTSTDMHVRRLALERGVPAQRVVGQDGLRMMDKMSTGRPHNVGSRPKSVPTHADWG